MVALKRELANILFHTTANYYSNNPELKFIANVISCIDVDKDFTRERTNTSSVNTSGECTLVSHLSLMWKEWKFKI